MKHWKAYLAIVLSLALFWCVCRPTAWSSGGLCGMTIRMPCTGYVSVIASSWSEDCIAVCAYNQKSVCVFEANTTGWFQVGANLR